MSSNRHIWWAIALRDLRKERGWSQSDLAAAVGCHVNTVQVIESGKHEPSIGLYQRMAEALGYEVELWPAGQRRAS